MRLLFSKLTALILGALALYSQLSQADTYCSASGFVTAYEWINRISVNGLSASPGANGYRLWSSPVFNMNSGSNSVTVAPGFSSYAYTENFAIYVDLNHDGQFSSNEKVFSGSTNSPLNGTINIPSTALSGPTRLRVAMEWGSSPAPCGSFTYGEVEDYTVNLTVSSATVTTGGFDQTYPQELVLNAQFYMNGVLYNSSNIYQPSMSSPRLISLNADPGTQIVWTAHVYLDDSAAGVFIPATCSKISGSSCITAAGSTGESVIFKAQPAPTTGFQADELISFDNMFGGATYAPGPTISLSGDVTASTTAPYFYNFSGAPFSSGYFSFINLSLGFSTPVLHLAFDAAGSCTNCTQTVNVSANGQIVKTFSLNYNVVSHIEIDLPAGAVNVGFDQNFKMDNLAIGYH